MTRKETARERWVRETRESVLRLLAKERIPLSACELEGNLDISTYSSGLGFMGRRSAREISSALRWLAGMGYVRRLSEDERTPVDPKGVLYEVTAEGVAAQVPR